MKWGIITVEKLECSEEFVCGDGLRDGVLLRYVTCLLACPGTFATHPEVHSITRRIGTQRINNRRSLRFPMCRIPSAEVFCSDDVYWEGPHESTGSSRVKRLAAEWNFTTDRFNYRPLARELNDSDSATVSACLSSAPNTPICRSYALNPAVGVEALLCEKGCVFLRSAGFTVFKCLPILTRYFTIIRFISFHFITLRDVFHEIIFQVTALLQNIFFCPPCFV